LERFVRRLRKAFKRLRRGVEVAQKKLASARALASNDGLTDPLPIPLPEAAMPEDRGPRLSHAMLLLPLLRAQLGAAASRYSLPAGLEIELLPIVEDGLFGYELLPNRDTHTYVTLGANADNAPVLRSNLYCASAPSALRLATVGGRALLQHELDAWEEIEQRDVRYRDWPSAAAAVWAELARLFADAPRYAIAIQDAGHAAFDRALAIARSRLHGSDPSIEFCGIPDEAQYGYVLKDARGGHGNLVLRSRGSWELHWTARAGRVDEQWRASTSEGAAGWACAAETLVEPMHPLAFRARDERKAVRRRR
jgi:hypothetical protein